MQLMPQREDYFGSSKPEVGLNLHRRYLRQRFTSDAGMLICTPWTWRPDTRNGDLRQGIEFYPHLPSLRARFMLAAWMVFSMRSMRNRDMNDGDSKRTRESDRLRPRKITRF